MRECRLPLCAAFAVLTSAACATRDDVVRWEDVDATHVEALASVAPVHASPSHVREVAVPSAPAPRTSEPVVIEGRAVDPGGLVDVRALELACLSDRAALTDPKGVRARFDDVAGRQLVPVGELSFIVLARDPSQSITDPPPQLCITIASSTMLRAPLIRAREPAGRWLVRRIGTGLVDDAAHLVRDGGERKLAHTAHPRVLVDDNGALVAIALPVTNGSE